MKFLRLKRHRVRSDGVRSVLPVVVEKTRRFGQVVHEQKLSVKRDVLLTGAHAAGKSRWLARMHEEAPGIWRRRPALLIRCVMPLSSWIDRPELQQWAERMHGRRWHALRSWERVDALVAWARQHRPVLLIDDAHLLTGRKADVMVRLLEAAPLAVVTASDEARLPIAFRLALARRNPQRVHLKSEAAYDVTPYVVWLIALLAIAAGQWELGAAAAGLNLFHRGPRAARQT